MNEREHLGSRLGFILISAGCAIGIGNVWKFPWLVGQYGGGAFVLIYLVFLAIMGVPVMTMEFAMGRAAQCSPVKMYGKLEPKGTKWHFHGIASLAGNYLLMMFYTTVAGWMLQYFVEMACGGFEGMDAGAVSDKFSSMLTDPALQVGYMAIIVIAGFAIVAMGLQKGLERVSKVMMTLLLVIMVVLAVNSIIIPGGGAGLSFYLLPNIEEVRKAGLLNVIVNAMNQAFFTLSIGIGAMAIFGSYIGRERSLLGESVNVALLDTFVAFTSGLIIFPACFAYGVEPGAGPSLIFITLPNIFNHMALGRLWGSLFFVFMTFAAFSTVLAVFENIMAMTMDLTGWDRKKTAVFSCVMVFILSLPCALGFNVLSWIQPLGKGTSFMDLEDFLVSNLLLPIGALVYVVFCTRKIGWGWKNFVQEANCGKGLKIQNWMRWPLTWILPVLIGVIIVVGLV
jgi:NSS family neurotransmitter:Na+ symporter